jgi:LysR family transcriptional regulator, carnitine catabolism transcriptional activator
VHEASYVPTILGLVAAGLGVAVLPEREFNSTLEGVVRMVPIRSPQLIRNIGIIGKSAKSLSPAAERFVEVLRQTISPSSRMPVVPLKASANRQP